MKFRAEQYPIIIQVIDSHIRPSLLAYSPDFDLRISEPYDSAFLGQTELLVCRMRDEIGKKIKLCNHLRKAVSAPDTSEFYKDLPGTDLLSSSQVSKLLRISRQTLWRLANKQCLPFVLTPGKHRRFLRADVENYLQVQSSKNR